MKGRLIMAFKVSKDFLLGMAVMAGAVAVAGAAYVATKKIIEYKEQKKCFDEYDEDDFEDYVDAPCCCEEDCDCGCSEDCE